MTRQLAEPREGTTQRDVPDGYTRAHASRRPRSVHTASATLVVVLALVAVSVGALPGEADSNEPYGR